jgi:hypothetical protein
VGLVQSVEVLKNKQVFLEVPREEILPEFTVFILKTATSTFT